MIDSNEILHYLFTNKKRLEQEYHLIKIGIFGSFARDEQTNNSDIDVIVEFEDNTSNLYELKQRLRNEIQSRFNLSVDICREKDIKKIFKQQILSEARYV